MADFGLAGVATINSAGAVGAAGQRVRVFDVALVNTAAAAGWINIRNGPNNSLSSGNPYLLVPYTSPFFNSPNGILFPDGAFVVATGCTANINFIREF